MGSLLSIFRSKSDTKALLEKIQNEIESIEDFKHSASRRQKNCFCLLFSAFVVIYLISALVFYLFVLMPNTIFEQLLCFSPFIISPFIFILVQRLFQYYYRWIGDNKEDRLRELKRQKKKILEKVKETENFKDAKEILEKYDPKALFESVSFKTLNVCSTPLLNNTPQRLPNASLDSQLRYRTSTTPFRPMPAIMPSPSYNTQPNSAYRPNLMSGQSIPNRGPVMTPQRMPVMSMAPPVRSIKPILPQNRTVMEKLVDYVVGDGPNNRYALVCIHCYSHNGMALKEEFEFIAFICCYCKRFNPSRKTRPLAPRLQSIDQNKSSLTPLIDEPESDTDSERGRIGTENSARIQEIITNTETDNQNEVQIERNGEKKVERSGSEESLSANVETVDRVAETDDSETTISATDGLVVEDKEDANRDNEEQKEIAFIDGSDTDL